MAAPAVAVGSVDFDSPLLPQRAEDPALRALLASDKRAGLLLLRLSRFLAPGANHDAFLAAATDAVFGGKFKAAWHVNKASAQGMCCADIDAEGAEGAGEGEGEDGLAAARAALVREALLTSAAGTEEWSMEGYADLSLFDDSELGEFCLGRRYVPMDPTLASSLASDITSISREVAGVLPLALPIHHGGPGEAVSELEIAGQAFLTCLPLPPVFPILRAFGFHGPKGIVPFASADASTDDLAETLHLVEDAKLVASTVYADLITSMFAQQGDTNVGDPEPILFLDWLHNPRWDWDLDGLHRPFTAGKILVVLLTLCKLMSMGVRQYFSCCSPARSIVVHLAACLATKVEIEATRAVRTVPGQEPRAYVVYTLSMCFHGVRAGLLRAPPRASRTAAPPAPPIPRFPHTPWLTRLPLSLTPLAPLAALHLHHF